MQAVAHVREDGTRETVQTHLFEVAELAKTFAASFDSSPEAALCGYLHDAGKYTEGFQRRILENGPKVDHGGYGAAFLGDLGRQPGYLGALGLFAYAVAGHHGGMPDSGSSSSVKGDGTLQGRYCSIEELNRETNKAWLQPFERECGAQVIETIKEAGRNSDTISRFMATPFSQQFWTRMVFSCLVDADFLCTEAFMNPAIERGLTTNSFAELTSLLEQKLKSFYPPRTPLNKKRCEVLDECLAAAAGNKGFYSLTVPTGGGKTFASLRFALNHAHKHGMDRVIICEPYTSIIDQTSDVYRAVLGDGNVLEHHSNFDFDAVGGNGVEEAEDGTLGNKLRLAAENWEMPLIITTNVQLYESLYSSKPSRCRKLHNIANSVIVLDEAQTLPLEFAKPCLRALEELVANYGCTVLFCTATQPALASINDAVAPVEIVSDVEGLFSALKRVAYVDEGTVTSEELAAALLSYEQVLCIVNSKKRAKELYENVENAFCLTTQSHAYDRRSMLREIRRRLVNGEPCRVIATSLIEAGVDLDFSVVYRELTGLDSVVQAAGRCNREGKLDAATSLVHVFSFDTDEGVPRATRQFASISTVVLSECEQGDGGLPLNDPEVVEAYFGRVVQVRNANLDKKEILAEFGSGNKKLFNFETVNGNFKLITDTTSTVIVPWMRNEEGVLVAAPIEEDLVAVREGRASRVVMRRLGQYSVSVYHYRLKELVEAGIVEGLAQDTYVLLDRASYSANEGLLLEAELGVGLYV